MEIDHYLRKKTDITHMTEEKPPETYCDKILAKTMDYCIFQEAPRLCQTLVQHYRKSCQTLPVVSSDSPQHTPPSRLRNALPDESFEIYKRSH